MLLVLGSRQRAGLATEILERTSCWRPGALLHVVRELAAKEPRRALVRAINLLEFAALNVRRYFTHPQVHRALLIRTCSEPELAHVKHVLLELIAGNHITVCIQRALNKPIFAHLNMRLFIR